jgi:hypothetical protein
MIQPEDGRLQGSPGVHLLSPLRARVTPITTQRLATPASLQSTPAPRLTSARHRTGEGAESARNAARPLVHKATWPDAIFLEL